MIRAIATLLLSLGLLATPVLGQDAGNPAHLRMDALKAQLAPGKQTFVSRQMDLSMAEEAEFWPVYDAYQRELGELLQRRRDNVTAYARASGAALDEEMAQALAEEAVEIELAQAELMEETFKKLSRSLSSAKALKYLQIEARLGALSRYEIAASLP